MENVTNSFAALSLGFPDIYCSMFGFLVYFLFSVINVSFVRQYVIQFRSEAMQGSLNIFFLRVNYSIDLDVDMPRIESSLCIRIPYRRNLKEQIPSLGR